MAKRIPQLRNIGWDITINDKNDVVLIEANGYAPGVDVQQAADGIGRRHLYTPLIEEIRNYKREQMKFLGWRVNNFINFRPAYDAGIPIHDTRLKLAMDNLVPDCASVMDVGCRQAKFAKSVCPAHVKYYPVDFKAYDEEIIACDFNDDFPDIKVDTCLCAYTAEFVEFLPQFLANMCNAAQKQILMWCRPVDKETSPDYRWNYPFLTDFTEEFLIKTLEQNHFRMNTQYPSPTARSVILYDFRRISDT